MAGYLGEPVLGGLVVLEAGGEGLVLQLVRQALQGRGEGGEG